MSREMVAVNAPDFCAEHLKHLVHVGSHAVLVAGSQREDQRLAGLAVLDLGGGTWRRMLLDLRGPCRRIRRFLSDTRRPVRQKRERQCQRRQTCKKPLAHVRALVMWVVNRGMSVCYPHFVAIGVPIRPPRRIAAMEPSSRRRTRHPSYVAAPTASCRRGAEVWKWNAVRFRAVAPPRSLAAWSAGLGLSPNVAPP